MEEHELLVVKWVNDLLGGRFVVPPHVVMETIVVIALILIFAIFRTRYSVESPPASLAPPKASNNPPFSLQNSLRVPGTAVRIISRTVTD